MSDVLYHALNPAKFRLDGGAMYGIIPKPLWEKQSPPDQLNRIDLALRCLLIQTESKNILIDTGIGDYHGEKFNLMFDIRSEKNPLALCLKELNLHPRDITDLVISHLHFDHVGGIGVVNTQGLMEPLFPHATLHLHRDHFAYSEAPSKRDTGSFHRHYYQPVLDFYNDRQQVNWLQGAKGVILTYAKSEKTMPNTLNFLTSNGHTPHLLHPFDKNFIYLADIIPTSNHVAIPWVMGYDIMPAVTTADKENILALILEKELTIIFEHDVNFWGCTLGKNGKGQIVAQDKFAATTNKIQKIFCSGPAHNNLNDSL